MKEFLKNSLPSFLLSFLRFIRHPLYCLARVREGYLVKVQPHRYENIVKRLRHKDKIKVAFFAIHSSVWKYDYLYKLMCEHPSFEPVIVVCPVVNYGFENMLLEMDKCYEMFKHKGYNVVRTYDVSSQTYMDVKKNINPDIVFYTNPYKGLIDDRYYITNFLDCLTCYAPYSASICSISSQFNKPLHLLAWHFFVENDLSYKIACKEMPNHAKNAVVVGYPSLDVMLEKSYIPRNVWKHSQKYKIIWAPHHSFDPECGIRFSNFFQVSDRILEMTERYKDTVQFAFKPHPLLYVKLLKVWGEEKTRAYYQRWADGVNTQYEDGEYIDLFMTSDAMIFDSVSFIHEYLFTKKKSLFIHGENIEQQLNEFGIEALHCHQMGYHIDDIERFVNDVVEEKPDALCEAKENYFEKNIFPTNSQLASQNILNVILKSFK